MPMGFRKATDELMAPISHEELADALGKSVPAIRQARLDQTAKAFRNPPEGWQPVVAKMARHRARKLLRLARSLGAERSGN